MRSFSPGGRCCSNRLQQLISPEFIGKRLSDNCSAHLNDTVG
jgi:hypothetical protein